MEPTIDTEAPEEIPADTTAESSSDITMDGSTLDSMEVAAGLKVTFKQVQFGDDGQPASYEDLKDAEITFLDNCVDSDGTVNKEADKISFKVTPTEGKKLSKVQYATAETEEGFAFETLAPSALSSAGDVKDANTKYEMKETVASLLAESNTKKQICIFITVEPVKYQVSFSGASVYLPDEQGNYSFTTAASSGTVNYSGSLTFAVKDATDAKTSVAASQSGSDKTTTLKGTDHEAVTEPAASAKPAYVEYTLNASGVEGLKTTDNDNITVSVSAIEDIKITLADPDIEKGTDVTVTSLTAEGYKELKASTFGVDDKLIFQTTLAKDSNYTLLAPEAYWTTSEKPEDKHTITVSEEDVTVGTETKSCFVIDLKSITEDANLHVILGSELDGEKDSVKTVTFKTAENVAVLDAKNKDQLGGSFKTTGEDYTFTVEAKDGYRVTKVEVTVDKKYEDTTKPSAKETFAIDKYGLRIEEENDFYPFNDKQEMKVSFKGEDPLPENAASGATADKWSAKSVEVSVETEVQPALAETTVAFISTAANNVDGYDIDVDLQDGKIEAVEDTDGSYKVKAGTAYLQFTVKDAKTAPVVKVNNNEKLAEPVEGEGFTYRVPAISLADNSNTISIARQTKKVSVNYNDAGSILLNVSEIAQIEGEEAEVSVDMSSDEKDKYDVKMSGSVNADAEVLIEGSLNSGSKAEITEVTFQVGDEAAKPAKLTEEGFEIRTTASEDITVYISKSTDKKLELTAKNGDETKVLTPDADGVYSVSYTDQITAKVYGKEQALALFSTVVKDGEKNAATKATITADGNAAEITVHASERNKVLTVTLTTLADRSKVEFKIKSETPVASVKYSGIEGGKLTLPVDTKVTSDVAMTAENAQLSNLRACIVAANATDAKTAEPNPNNFVEVALVNGKLTVTALPSKTDGLGQENAARIVLYDVKDPDRKFIEGSEILVTTKDADVVGKKATISGSIEATAKTLRVPITSDLAGAGENLEKGDLYYKVDVTGPSTAVSGDLGDAIKAAMAKLAADPYYKKADVDKNGGVSLQVIADQIEKGGKTIDIAGGAAGDFSVTVSLVQTIDGNKPIASNSIVVPGETKTASTQEARYENTKTGKLKLKNGTTTINTGNENWIVVATPQFDEAVGYASVKAEFVNTKTGVGVGDENKYNGLTVRYNDMTQAVEVKSSLSASYKYYQYNVNGVYKDLGVKVTAVTEATGYGVSGTVKLNVVNGVESISASAQPYVLKNGNKNVTFKVDVVLNSSTTNSKWAPKNKKVTYHVVSEDGRSAGPVGVTEKNGTVTVAPSVPAGTKFKVLVKSTDGTKATGTTSAIEVIDKKLALGDLVIMTKNSGKYVPVENPSVLEVTGGWAPYYAVVLKDGVDEEKKAFLSADVIPFRALNYTPAKGNIYVDGNDGQIYVKKLGKATFTAADKTDKTNKTNSLKVEFKQTSKEKVLQISKFSDSNLYGDTEAPTYDKAVSFSGSNTTYFGLNVVTRGEKEGDKDTVIDLSDVKLGFKKNVKNVTPKNYDRYQYVVAVTGSPATITFTSKSQGNAEYTFTNASLKTAKAPKLALNPKTQKAIQGNTATLTYQVTSSVKNEALKGDYVMLSVDSSKKNPDDVYSAFKVLEDEAYVDYIDRAIPIRSGSLFDLKIYARNAGSYNLNVAVGTLENGVFTQEYADAKLAVKVAKSNINLKVTGKYTLDPQFATWTNIVYNNKDAKAWFANNGFVQTDGKRNYAMNAIDGNKENRFNEYFIARTNEDGYIGTIGLRDDLTKVQIEEIQTDAFKEHLTGFLSVSNGSKQVDVKITMAFKPVKKLKAVSTSVLTGDNMTADIQIFNGKELVPVKADYKVTGETAFAKDTIETNWITNPVMGKDKEGKDIVLGGNVRLTGKGIAAGKQKFTLEVTPVYAAKESKAIPVDVTVNVVNSESAKNKVVLAKGGNKWVVSNNDYVGPTGAENEPALGAWVTKIPYTFKDSLSIAEGTPISVAPDAKVAYVSFESVDNKYSVNGSRALKVVVDKEKLLAAVNEKKVKMGGKVTVKPVFSYGDAEHATSLKEDTVSISITLPKTLKESVATADFEAAEAEIQSMVETLTAHNKKIGKPAADSNEEIKGNIEARIRSVADAATATVTVTHNGTEKAYANEYTALVKNGTTEIYKGIFKENAKTTAEAVIAEIDALSDQNWQAVKDDAKLKDLFTLTKDSTDGEYQTMIRNILEKKGAITRNIGLTVIEEERRQPTEDNPGTYNVMVYVTDKAVAENSSEDTEVSYEFATIEKASEAKNRLTEELEKADVVKEIVSEAWKAVVATGKANDDNAFNEAISKNIVDHADALLKAPSDNTKNENLSVEMKKDSFSKTLTGKTLSALGYTLVIKDSASKKNDQEVPMTLSSNVEILSHETEAELFTRLNATQLTVSGSITTKEEACDAVKAKIAEKSENPTFDSEALTATAVADSFVAPKGDANGLVSVKVVYTVDEQEKASATYNNIVILASGDDFEVDEDEIISGLPEDATEEDKENAIEEAKVRARVVGMVKTQLSKEAFEAKVAALTEAGTTVDGDAIIVAIKELAEKILEDSGYELVADSVKFTATEGETSTVEAPTGTKEGLIPDFTLEIQKKSDVSSDAGTEAKKTTIEVKAITLDPMDLRQTLEEANAAVGALIGTTKTLTINYVDAGQTKTEGSEEVTGVTAKTLTDAVAAVLQEEVTGKDLTVTVATVDSGENATKYVTSTTYDFVAENLTATVTGGEAIAISTVNVRTKDNTPAVESVQFTKVKEKEIVYDENGIKDEQGNGSNNNPVEITVEGKDVSVPIVMTVETTSAATDAAYKDLEMTVTGVDGADTEGIKIEKATAEDTYTMVIPDKAAGAEKTRDLSLKLTATSKKKDVDGQLATAEVYVKLTFKPTVTGVSIKDENPTIEIDKDSRKSGDVTYSAALTGYHLHATDVPVWNTDSFSENTAITVAEVSEKQPDYTSAVKVSLDYSSADKVDEKFTLEAKDTLGKDNEAMATPAKKDITIVDNKTSSVKIAVALTTGVTKDILGSTANETVKTDKYIVSGDVAGVALPLSITGYTTERDWTYTVAKATESGADGQEDDVAAKPIDTKIINGKWHLVIDEAIEEMLDEKLDKDGKVEREAAKYTLTATSKADEEGGALAAVSTEYTFALVVDKSVTGMQILNSEDENDEGEGMIEASKTAGTELTVTLKPAFEGNHIPDAEADAVKYRLTSKTKGVAGATIAKNVITIPAMATTGYIEVTATYGTGDEKITATRTIKVAEATTLPTED